MNYLEVKYKEDNTAELDTNDFISNVISSQKTLGFKKDSNSFDHEKLVSLGFVYNPSTSGYSLVKDFSLSELENLALEIEKLDNHMLTHEYIVLKIYQGKLYLWDTALIYEDIDTFEYCLKYHNLFDLGEINLLSKSDSINEKLLNMFNFTKRYEEPSLEFITQNCVWDKKQGLKILKDMVYDINEYLSKDEVISYKA